MPSNSTRPTATCCTNSSRHWPTSAVTTTVVPWKTACAMCWKYLPPCAPPTPAAWACAFRPATGSKAGGMWPKVPHWPTHSNHWAATSSTCPAGACRRCKRSASDRATSCLSPTPSARPPHCRPQPWASSPTPHRPRPCCSRVRRPGGTGPCVFVQPALGLARCCGSGRRGAGLSCLLALPAARSGERVRQSHGGHALKYTPQPSGHWYSALQSASARGERTRQSLRFIT